MLKHRLTSLPAECERRVEIGVGLQRGGTRRAPPPEPLFHLQLHAKPTGTAGTEKWQESIFANTRCAGKARIRYSRADFSLAHFQFGAFGVYAGAVFQGQTCSLGAHSLQPPVVPYLDVAITRLATFILVAFCMPTFFSH